MVVTLTGRLLPLGMRPHSTESGRRDGARAGDRIAAATAIVDSRQTHESFGDTSIARDALTTSSWTSEPAGQVVHPRSPSSSKKYLWITSVAGLLHLVERSTVRVSTESSPAATEEERQRRSEASAPPASALTRSFAAEMLTGGPARARFPRKADPQI